MARVKLSDTFAAKAVLPPGKSEVVFADSDTVGFGLRIRGASRSWVLTYRPAGQGRGAAPKRLRLGSPETVSAVKARLEAKKALGHVAAGQDPLADRQVLKKKSESTVEKLLDRYDADLKRRGYVNRTVVMSGLRKRLHSLLAHDIREVTGEEIADIITATKQAKLVGAAEDFRSRSRAFFTWCVASAKVLKNNPLTGHRKERATRADRIAQAQHGRALSDAELTKVLATASVVTVFGRYQRFLILTGCRRSEGAGLTWSMVDREAAVINLPAAFVKQGRGHAVPIAPALAELLDACMVDARSDLVFPSPKTGGRLSGWTSYVVGAVTASGVDFGLHDLRRTFRTGLARLGVSSEVAELALGHARTELESIYNRDSGAASLRSAFELWASHVQTLLLNKV